MNKEQRHSLVGQADIWEVQGKFQIDFLKQMGLKVTDKLLDIGCGTMRGGRYIVEYLDTEHYVGLEVREKILEEGHKELEEENLTNKNPNLIYFKDFSDKDINILVDFDIIWSFATLIYMEGNILKKCFKVVSESLKQDGVFYANVNITDEAFQRSWAGFPLMFKPLEYYEKVAGAFGLVVENIGTIHSFGHPNTVKNDVDKDKFQQIMLKITLK